MEECDTEAFSTATRSLVDKTNTCFLGFSKLVLNAFHGKSDVVHATFAVVLLDESSDGALGAGGFQQLNLGLAATQEGGPHLLVGDFLNGIALGAEEGLKERDGLVEAGHGDSNVLNVSRIHDLFK